MVYHLAWMRTIVLVLVGVAGGNGASVDGPKQTFAAAGTYTFSFAIMHKADLLAWLP